jgi:phosphoheptose isomerase
MTRAMIPCTLKENSMIIDFENIQKRCEDACESAEYLSLVDKVNKAKKIFLLGNGGLHFVSCHMSTDLTRLIKDKAVYSFDSVGFITSNANDHGHEQVFLRWLETIILESDNPDDFLVIGMSCSGNSINVINALHWAKERGMDTFMISGQKSDVLDEEISELAFECDYFHTVEVMCMMLMYELIHRTENRCPSIRGEKNRLENSPLRGGTQDA